MSPQTDTAQSGVHLDHRVVDGIDVATIEVEVNTPGGASRLVSWMIGVGDDGVRFIHPFGMAPFRDGIAAETADAVADWISSMPRPASDVLKQALRDVSLIPSLGSRVTIVDSAITTSAILKGVPAIDPRQAMNALFAPIRARIGKTRFDIHGANGRIEAFFMSLRQVEGYEAFVQAKPWYLAAARAHPHLDFDAPSAVVEGRLLHEMGLPVALASRLGETAYCVHSLRNTLRAAPLDWIPAKDDVVGWAGLKVIDEVLSSLRMAREFHPTLLAPIKGRWPDYVRKLARPYEFGGDAILRMSSKDLRMKDGQRSPLAMAARDFHDVFVRWNEFLMDFAGAAAFEVPSLAQRALVGDRGLGAVMELSRRWHADPAFEAGSDVPYREWPAIVPAWRDEATGIDVVPLLNSVELAREGAKGMDPDGQRGLGHCVGGESYVKGCADGEMRIVSLRRDGARLSTAQIDLDPMETPVLFQHRGMGNAVPPPEAEDALARYLNLRMTQASRRGPAIPDQVVPSAPETDFMAEKLEAWRPYLAGEFRTATLDTLPSIAGLEETVSGFSP